MPAPKPRQIHVRSAGTDPFAVKVTDEDGNPIDGIRSITWRAAVGCIPTAVIEIDGLELDVVAEECVSTAKRTLDEVQAHANHAIEQAQAAMRAFDGHPAAETARGELIAWKRLRARFFDRKET